MYLRVTQIHTNIMFFIITEYIISNCSNHSNPDVQSLLPGHVYEASSPNYPNDYQNNNM